MSNEQKDDDDRCEWTSPSQRTKLAPPREQRRALWRGVAGAGVLLATVALFCGAGVVLASLPVDTSLTSFGLREPKRHRSAFGRLRHTLRVDASADPNGLVYRHYDGATPGPTLLVEPGDTVTLTVANGLGDEAGDDAARSGLAHPNSTSLHAHGWHVSPAEDNVFAKVPPGSSRDYVYHLPKSHPPGTYWYHPHLEGSSGLQEMGMAGALVVLDADRAGLPPAVVMLVQTVNVVAGKPRNYAWASAASGSRLPILWGGPAYAGGGADAFAATVKDAARGSLAAPYLAVNGAREPTLQPPAGRWLRWRIIHGGSSEMLALAFDQEGACEAWVVARDGVTRATPKPLATAFPLVIAPGSRADVFARCWEPTALRSADRPGLDAYLGPSADLADAAILHVEPVAAALRPADDEPPRLPPPRLASLLDARPDRRATLAMYEGGKVTRDGNAYTEYGLNVVAGDGTVRQGDVIEWVVVNAEGYAQHPFHMHTNHFQIADMSHGEGIDYDVGDWRDTITLPTPGNVTIRFVAADYHGRSLAHCHVFAHADTGMAHEVHILPP